MVKCHMYVATHSFNTRTPTPCITSQWQPSRDNLSCVPWTVVQIDIIYTSGSALRRQIDIIHPCCARAPFQVGTFREGWRCRAQVAVYGAAATFFCGGMTVGGATCVTGRNIQGVSTSNVYFLMYLSILKANPGSFLVQ